MGWIDAFFSVITTQTTAGFEILPFSQFDPGSKFLLLASMLIGGGTLSTAGGIKILRLFIILQALRSLFFRTSLTKSSVLSEKHYPEVINCMSIFALYILTIFLSALPFAAMGYPLLDSLFDIVAALGTAGVSSGITDASLPTLLKIVLSVDMLLGRLEIVTLLVIFYRGTLIGRRNKL
ncbi:MAG: TrkH family potassium uptake protein [Chlamydiales bacterium]|nr:TrkH family potassium uptake protein [Chlamydiales bacterium]